MSELESWLVRRKEVVPVRGGVGAAERIAKAPAQRFGEMLEKLDGLEDFSALLLHEVGGTLTECAVLLLYHHYDVACGWTMLLVDCLFVCVCVCVCACVCVCVCVRACVRVRAF